MLVYFSPTEISIIFVTLTQNMKLYNSIMHKKESPYFITKNLALLNNLSNFKTYFLGMIISLEITPLCIMGGSHYFCIRNYVLILK